MEPFLIYALLTSAAFYLGSRAVITRKLWSRYPINLAKFMDCAACSGAWYGFLASAILRLPLPGILANEWASVPVIGLCSIVWTPIVAGLMQAGFERLGSALPEDEL
jgi:hypothetical protein